MFNFFAMLAFVFSLIVFGCVSVVLCFLNFLALLVGVLCFIVFGCVNGALFCCYWGLVLSL